jgi:hypothetical protein
MGLGPARQARCVGLFHRRDRHQRTLGRRGAGACSNPTRERPLDPQALVRARVGHLPSLLGTNLQGGGQLEESLT